MQDQDPAEPTQNETRTDTHLRTRIGAAELEVNGTSTSCVQSKQQTTFPFTRITMPILAFESELELKSSCFAVVFAVFFSPCEDSSWEIRVWRS